MSAKGIPSSQVSRFRGTPMAIACGTVIAGALGSMYFMGRDVKGKEGQASAYKSGEGVKGSDLKMTSSDVAAAVSVPKPNNQRLESSGGHKQ